MMLIVATFLFFCFIYALIFDHDGNS